MLKKFLKNYRDKNLFSIRKQVYKLIDENSRVVDLGCGDGELLRILSSKINYGLGIDEDKKEIKFAEQLTKKTGIKNLEFKVADANLFSEGKFDYSVLMFVLHSLNYASQIKVLNNAKRNSDKLIIVDFDLSARKNLLIHLDEILEGHYKHFMDYLSNRGVENLVADNSTEKINTNKNYLKIWEIDNMKK